VSARAVARQGHGQGVVCAAAGAAPSGGGAAYGLGAGGARRSPAVQPVSAVASKPVNGAASAERPHAVGSQGLERGSMYRPRFGPKEERKGCDILVEALEFEGVETVFAYPGGASMEIHQALTRSKQIKNILCRHEQGEVFAAVGFSKCTGKTSVCIATSGPGATNLVTGLADAMLDSVPMVAITGQVARRMIGTDAFQETPIVEITRSITKHNYLVMNVEDIPRIIKEAFFLASTGRPGPVLVDIPKDVQQAMHCPPTLDPPMRLANYMSRLPGTPTSLQMERVIEKLLSCKRPVLYVGGGSNHASQELRELQRLTGIPVVETLMGLGAFPNSHEDSYAMLGMHGTVAANYSVDQADLLLALGVRFDDRVTGKLEAFATHASIVHVDIDPAEIHKNKHAHVPICADVKEALALLNGMLSSAGHAFDFGAWRAELSAKRAEYPLKYDLNGQTSDDDIIVAQHAIEVLCEETGGKAIVTTGVGQHQMWAAQYYKYDEPRNWVSSGGLGSMGFGLPSALGAAAARPDDVVVNIDGDGSFVMNIQELATASVYQLPVKTIVLNNQHLGMVVQWEDRFYNNNRAHTYLGLPDKPMKDTHDVGSMFPDFVKIAEGFMVPSARVTRRKDLRAAIRTMLDTPGPYLLDVSCPHTEGVLPMIPGGGSFADVITEPLARKFDDTDPGTK